MSGIFETKNRILKSLMSKPKTGKQLAEELGLTQATLTQHLHELEEKGLVKETESGFSKRWKYYEVNAATYEKMTAGNSFVRSAAGTAIAAIVVLVIATLVVGRMPASTPVNALAYNNSIPGNPDVYPDVSVNATTSVAGNASSQEIAPGGLSAAYACPLIAYSIQNATVTQLQGFNESVVDNYTDLVIAPGNMGNLTYVIYIVPIKANEGNNMTLNLYNDVSLFHESPNGTAMSDSSPGINITYNPVSYTEPYPSAPQNFTFDVQFNVSSSAALGTYWMRMATCEGSITPMLLTVGSAPYNGTVHVTPAVYA